MANAMLIRSARVRAIRNREKRLGRSKDKLQKIEMSRMFYIEPRSIVPLALALAAVRVPNLVSALLTNLQFF